MSDPYAFENTIYSKNNGVALLTLNNPEKMNSLGGDMVEGWLAALDDAENDPDIGAFVVTGSGDRAFCAGAQPGNFAARNDAGQPGAWQGTERFRYGIHKLNRLVEQFSKPYIAAVNGAAAGPGMDLASMSDIRFCSDQARFRMAYVRMGLVPGDGGAYYLPRIVGVAKALDLIWTGKIIDAQEALRIGYVNEVVPHGDLLTYTIGYAEQLAKGPKIAIKFAKRLVYNGLTMTLDQSLEAAAAAFSSVQQTEDHKEGPKAFLEKREPEFRGY